MPFKTFMTFATEEPKSNALVFPTRHQAEAYGTDLHSRWMQPTGYEVREVAEDATHIFNGRAVVRYSPFPYWVTDAGVEAGSDLVGELRNMLAEANPATAQAQLDAHYQHGGGFRPFQGFQLTFEGLVYPGDPAMPELARAQLRDESVRLFAGAWVAVVQPDGTFVVSRMD